jgi:hypothetical protein
MPCGPRVLHLKLEPRLFGLRKGAATGQHEFDLLCADLGIEHRLAPPMRPQSEPLFAIGPRTMASGRVERFNGRIEDVLQSHRFQSGEDLEQTLLRYVHLYYSQLPQSVLKGDPQSAPSRTGNVKGPSCSGSAFMITRDGTAKATSSVARSSAPERPRARADRHESERAPGVAVSSSGRPQGRGACSFDP